MKKRFSRLAVSSMVFTGLIVGATVLPPIAAQATFAEAAIVDVELAKYTNLDTTYDVITGVGSHNGTFTVNAGSMAELAIILKGNKTAKIKIPDELVGVVTATGDAAVEVGFTLNLTEIPLIDNLLTTAENAVDTLTQLIDAQSLFHMSVNLTEVKEALQLFEQLRNLNVVAKSATVETSADGKYLAVTFDDSTTRFIADKLTEAINSLQAAINAFEIKGSNIIGMGINFILAPVKAVINFILGQVSLVGENIAGFIKFIGDAAVLKYSTVTIPTSVELTQTWLEENAPNGLTTKFEGTITEPGLIELGFFETSNNTKTVVIADVVAPKIPVINSVEGSVKAGFTLNITAEAGSTVNVTNEEGTVIGTATVAGVADGKTQGDVTIELPANTVKGGITAYVSATDAAGNVSEKASTALGKEVTPIKLYRAYNPNSGEHLYTASQGEYNNVVSLGWVAEGTAWNAASSGSPVFRLYNPNSGEHFYTLDENEYNSVAAAGWNKEGVAFYSADATETPIYRVFNPNATSAGSHHYTPNKVEADWLVSLGWKAEGISFYGLD